MASPSSGLAITLYILTAWIWLPAKLP